MTKKFCIVSTDNTYSRMLFLELKETAALLGVLCDIRICEKIPEDCKGMNVILEKDSVSYYDDENESEALAGAEYLICVSYDYDTAIKSSAKKIELRRPVNTRELRDIFVRLLSINSCPGNASDNVMTELSGGVSHDNDVGMIIEDHCAILDDRRIRLTSAEERLLSVLLDKKGAVVTRLEAFEAVCGGNTDNAEYDDNIVAVYISYLRHKLEGQSSRKIIHTIRGQGYMIK